LSRRHRRRLEALQRELARGHRRLHALEAAFASRPAMEEVSQTRRDPRDGDVNVLVHRPLNGFLDRQVDNGTRGSPRCAGLWHRRQLVLRGELRLPLPLLCRYLRYQRPDMFQVGILRGRGKCRRDDHAGYCERFTKGSSGSREGGFGQSRADTQGQPPAK